MKIVKQSDNCKILVVGDIMLDTYIVGDVERISPEAPVPVVDVTRQFSTLGGCGNVVSNLRELGVNVECCSIIGEDDAGERILEKLKDINCNIRIIKDSRKKTPVKERIVASHRMTQLLRIDRENRIFLKPEDIISTQDIIDSQYDIIIISDYNKGAITKDLVDILKASEIPIIVDPKLDNIYLYNDVFMITPNQKEYSEIKELDIELYNRFVLKTLGKDGMQLICDQWTAKIPSTPVDVYNVSGAGDTVVAVIATCIAMGIDEITSAKIANDAARYVVQKPGTTTVPRIRFNEILKCYG